MRLAFRVSLLLGCFSVACGGKVVVDGAPSDGDGEGGFGGDPASTATVTSSTASTSPTTDVAVSNGPSVTTGQGGYGAAPGQGGYGAAGVSTGQGAYGGEPSYGYSANYASSGPGGCARCYQAITGEADPSALCPESYDHYAAIVSCVCEQDCSGPCKETCYGGSNDPGSGCENCIYAQCDEELQACFNDF